MVDIFGELEDCNILWHLLVSYVCTFNVLYTMYMRFEFHVLVY